VHHLPRAGASVIISPTGGETAACVRGMRRKLGTRRGNLAAGIRFIPRKNASQHSIKVYIKQRRTAAPFATAASNSCTVCTFSSLVMAAMEERGVNVVCCAAAVVSIGDGHYRDVRQS